MQLYNLLRDRMMPSPELDGQEGDQEEVARKYEPGNQRWTVNLVGKFKRNIERPG